MTIPPKTVRVVYKGIQAQVTYIPEQQKWKWEFVVTHKITFSDMDKSEKEATLSIKKEIDRYLSSQEKVLSNGRKKA